MGVTGLPSDEAVVDSEVSADGGDPAAVRPGDDRLQRGLLPGRRQGRRGDRLLERRGRRAARAGCADPRLQGRRIRGAALSGAGADGLAQDDRGRSRPGRRGGRGDDPRLRASRSRIPSAALDDLLGRSRASTAPNRRRSCGRFGPDLRPAPFDPRCSWRMGGTGTSSTGCLSRAARRRHRRSSTCGQPLVAEQALDELRQLAHHLRARHDQVDARLLGGPLRLDVDVGVVAEHRHPGGRHRRRVARVEVGRPAVGVDRAPASAARPRPRGRRRPAPRRRGREHQVGNDGEDAGHG